MTKIVLIQLLFLSLLLNKKNQNEKNGVPCYLHTIQKSNLRKTRESHLSVDWVIERNIISFCLGKVKALQIIIACQS